MHDSRDPADLLRAMDLNLVVAFDVLARERSVTRAAQRAGVTQSAMSHSLARMRALLGDPLFVRAGGRLVPTPRAEALVVPVRAALAMLGRALAEGEAFDPLTARRGFFVASPDLFDLLVVPPLLETIRDAAPGIDVSVLALEERRMTEQLETGELDVAISPQIEDAERLASPVGSSGIARRMLFREGFACFVRAGHPALGRRRQLSLAAFLDLAHVLVSPRGTGPGVVDAALAARGHRRRVAVRVPNFFTALTIIAKSDLVLTAPTSLARLLSDRTDVASLPSPIALPTHTLNMLWHERFSRDAGHQWLRAAIATAAKTARPA